MSDPKAIQQAMASISAGGSNDKKIDWLIESVKLLNEKLNTINNKLDKVINQHA
ncbi:MAG: hypothetical protein JRN37_06595 [Nitrososphaerota archaeon]|jgi:outer membrane murein-binding lipoprotein Lpp|nr:hypothetical protein [Nitrososphaerota archaeon]MDG7038805.1 hypothetical protein [Nitrososphaerota archaeon]